MKTPHFIRPNHSNLGTACGQAAFGENQLYPENSKQGQLL